MEENNRNESIDDNCSENNESDGLFEEDNEIDSDYEFPDDCLDNDEDKEQGSRPSKLTPKLKGLLGAANLNIVRGEIDTAIQMCMEVIREQSKAWEPYFMLSQIYENTDLSKSKNYLVMAAYLNPRNAENWCRLAEMALSLGEKEEAMSFYSKCLSHSKDNIEVHYKRLELAKELGHHWVPKFQAYLITKLPLDKHEEIIETATMLTRRYHSEKKYLRALEVLQIPFKRIPHCMTSNHLNMMLELLLLTEKYVQCLDFLVDFGNFTFDIVVGQDNSIIINDYSIPDNISIDLQTKFVICAIKLNCFNVAEQIIDIFVKKEDVENVGDLYLDICEALMAVKKCDLALKLLIPLKKSKNFSLPAVLLKYAECLAACGMKEQAVEAYYSVIALAPHHVEVLHPLSQLLLELKKEEEALEAMSYQAKDRLNVKVLMIRMKMLKQLGHLEELWKCLELLLSRHCIVFKNISEVKQVLSGSKAINKLQRVKKTRDFLSDTSEIIPNADTNCIMEPEVNEEFDFLKEFLQFAMDIRDFSNMEKFAVMAITSKKFEKFLEELSLFVVVACLLNGDLRHGYYLIRDFVIKYPKNSYFWNLFNLFTAQNDNRMHKFIFRLQRKSFAENEACDLLEANADFYFGNYHSSMKYFLKEFRLTKSPYVAFILGIILMHLGTIKRTTPQNVKMQLTETTTSLFLFYKRNRSKMAEQEIFYNLGRMYCQLGIMYLAELFFSKVLEVKNTLLTEHPDILCLKYEAAYNLHLIYQKTNPRLARMTLIKYLTI